MQESTVLSVTLQILHSRALISKQEKLGVAHLEAVAARVQSPDQAHSNTAAEEGQQDAEAAEVLQRDPLADQHIPQHQEVRQCIVHTPHH